MFLRRFWLGLGGLAMLAGLVLTVMWLHAPVPTVRRSVPAREQSVLVAARPITAGTVVESADIVWKEVPESAPVGERLIRGQFAEASLFGSAARRGFAAGEPLAADAFVRPGEPGYLMTVLRPGMRAVAIAVGLAEGGAGLITPGERVDILMTQRFDQAHLRSGFRTAGETVLRDLRVLAVDRAMQTAAPVPQPSPGYAGGPPTGAPKTVTLEVTSRQARVLMVASRIGQLQLALRGKARTNGIHTSPQPVWAAEISPALRIVSGEASLTPQPVAANSGSAPSQSMAAVPTGSGSGVALSIVRGTKLEWRCFDPALRPLDCGTTMGLPAPPAEVPENRTAPRPAGGVATTGLAPAS